MKKKMGIVALLVALICMFSACSIPFAYPDGGKYYCEELQMVLDFSSRNNEARFKVNNEEVLGHFVTGYDAHIYVGYVVHTADGRVVHDVLSGDFKYRSGKVTIKTDEGEKYTFLPLEE